MIIERFPEPIDAVAITDTFQKPEFEAILDEAKTLLHGDAGAGVWINEAYADIESSAINNSLLNSLLGDEVFGALEETNTMYSLFRNANSHSTLVNYYGNRQSSPMRYDSAAFIAKTFLYSEPKNFTGGNFTLQINADVAYEKDVENNMTVIFPASYYHQVSEVSLNDANLGGSGLYVATTYFFIRP